MKHSLALLLMMSFGLAPLAAWAQDTSEILQLVQTSRAKTVGFIMTDDDNMRNTLLSEINAASQEVDMRTNTMLEDEDPSEATKKKLTEFKAIWADFVQTRDGDIIPAAMAGDKDKGRTLDQTVQAERFKKMQALLK